MARKDLQRTPKGAHPTVWRLRLDLLLCGVRLPHGTAEARLLDALRLYVQLECTAPVSGRALTPGGPRWAACLRAVAATAALCSTASQAILAPWVLEAERGGAPAPDGVVGAGVVGVDFRPFGS